MSQNKSYLPLSGNKLFNGVQISVKEKFPQSNFINFSEGDVVYQSGDTSDCLYLVLAGEVKIKIPVTMGGPSIERKGKNEFFGEKELMENIPRRSSAVANTGCTLYKLLQKDVKRLMSLHKKIGENISGETTDIASGENIDDDASFDESADFSEDSAWIETSEKPVDNTENTEPESEEFSINEIKDQVDDIFPEELPDENSDIETIEGEKTVTKEGNVEEEINFDSFGNVHDGKEPAGILDINEETVVPKQDDLNEEIKDESGLTIEQNEEAESTESELKESEPLTEITGETIEVEQDIPNGIAENEVETTENELKEPESSTDIPYETNETEQNIPQDLEEKEVESTESQLDENEPSVEIPIETNETEEKIPQYMEEKDDETIESELKDQEPSVEIPIETNKAEENKLHDIEENEIETTESQLNEHEPSPEIPYETNETEEKIPQNIDGKEFEPIGSELKDHEPSPEGTYEINEAEQNLPKDIEEKEVESTESELKDHEPSVEIPDETNEAEQNIPQNVEEKEIEEKKLMADELFYKKVLNAVLLINKENELKDILHSITQTLKEIVKADVVEVYLYDPDKNELYTNSVYEEKERRIKVGEGLTGWAAAKKEIIMLNSGVEDSRYNTDKDNFDRNNNVFLLPVVGSSEELVSLLLLTKVSEEFTGKDKEFLTELAIPIAAAIEKGKLFDSHLKKNRLEYLNKISGFIFNSVNTPVQIIQHYAEFIKKKTDVQDVVQIADFICEQTHTVENSVELLSDFTEGKNSLSLEQHNLNELLNSILEMLAEYVETRNVKLFKKLETDVKINADKTALYFVCLQITKNACDAMPEGGSFYLSTSMENDFVNIEFKDTGSGIPSVIKDKIFEPFFSFGKQNDAGLGLAVSEIIIKNHGGTVYLGKTAGDGTSIIISLPVVL